MKDKAKAWGKKKSYLIKTKIKQKKPKESTHIQQMHIHFILPTIDSLISSNSKASSVFS